MVQAWCDSSCCKIRWINRAPSFWWLCSLYILVRFFRLHSNWFKVKGRRWVGCVWFIKFRISLFVASRMRRVYTIAAFWWFLLCVFSLFIASAVFSFICFFPFAFCFHCVVSLHIFSNHFLLLSLQCTCPWCATRLMFSLTFCGKGITVYSSQTDSVPYYTSGLVSDYSNYAGVFIFCLTSLNSRSANFQNSGWCMYLTIVVFLFSKCNQ